VHETLGLKTETRRSPKSDQTETHADMSREETLPKSSEELHKTSMLKKTMNLVLYRPINLYLNHVLVTITETTQ